MDEPEEFEAIRLRARPSELVVLSIPSDTLALIHRVSAAREMTAEALLKLYIGQGFRRDTGDETQF